MKKAVSLLLFTLLAMNVRAQSDTVWQMASSNLPSGITSMIWSSVDTGFLLIPFKTVARTTDSGVSFTNLTFPKVLVQGGNRTDLNKQIDQVADMAWPSQAVGFVSGTTAGDDTMHTAHPTILATADAGTNWSQYYPTDTTLSFAHLYFSSPQNGWATGQTTDEKSFIAKTTDGGKTWTALDKSTTYVYGWMSFKDAQHGLVLVQEAGTNKLHVMSTYDGWATTRLSPSLGDSAPLFAYWGNDSVWLVGSNGLRRTTDSGATWTTVLQDNIAGGHIATGAFRDSVGFVARDIYSTTFRTRDFGATWVERRLADSVVPGAFPDFGIHLLSMPTKDRLYFLGQHPGDQAFEVMKMTVPKPSSGGGGEGVALVPQAPSGLSLETVGNSLVFTVAATAQPRMLEVLDLLGRSCATVTVPSMGTTAVLPWSMLPSGSYFARLGTMSVKFTIWN